MSRNKPVLGQKKVVFIIASVCGGVFFMCCGGCGIPLVTGIAHMVFYNVVFLCQACGAFNELMMF